MRILKGDKLLINGARDRPMQVPAATLEQGLVSGVANDCMLERVHSLRRDPSDVNQLRVGQSAQRAWKLFFGDRMDRMDQFVGKIAADYGADLDDFLGRAQPV